MLNRMFEKLKNLHLMLFTIIYIIINKKVCVFLPCFHTWVEEMSVFWGKAYDDIVEGFQCTGLL